MTITAIGVVGLYDTIFGQILPDSGLPAIAEAVAGWDWKMWIIAVLVTICIAMMEGLRREVKSHRASSILTRPLQVFYSKDGRKTSMPEPMLSSLRLNK